MSTKGKMRLSKSKMTPQKYNICQEKIFYYYFHTVKTQSMSHSIYLYQSVKVSTFTVSVFIFFTLTNIPFLFTAIPQHIIISLMHCIGYTSTS